MLCDHCIKEIASNLSKNAQKIISVLSSGDMHKAELIKKSGLTYATTLSTIRELEGTQLIMVIVVGKSKVCKLSNSGKRLIEIYTNIKGGDMR